MTERLKVILASGASAYLLVDQVGSDYVPTTKIDQGLDGASSIVTTENPLYVQSPYFGTEVTQLLVKTAAQNTETAVEAMQALAEGAGLKVAVESGIVELSGGDVAIIPVPDDATYFRYGARLTAASYEVKACPASGVIVVTNVRVRSKSDTPSVVTLYFDVNNDQSTFDNGTDQLVDDIDLKSSSTTHPGSNSGIIYELGLTDDDLRVDVTGGDVTLLVEGYTIP